MMHHCVNNIVLNFDEFILNGYVTGKVKGPHTFENIGKQYISNIFKHYKLHQEHTWDGIDKGSHLWHNDSVEGMSSSFLIYYDNAKIAIKGGLSEKTLSVNNGDFVWINQHPRFKHKAIPVEKHRRILAFEIKHELI